MLRDDQDEALDGSQHGYALRFTKEQIPPAKFFWSWTMYNLPQRLLINNPIDRYSIGSATPGIEYADDGSLTIYLTNESPGEDEESNWLPAPDGPFWIVLRTYGPGESILRGTYQVPRIKKVD